MLHRILVVILLSVLLQTHAQTASRARPQLEAWPMFRGNVERTGALTVHGPVGQPVELWRAATGREIVSSPAVVDGVIYVGSNDGYLYAMRADSGDVLWRYRAGGGVLSSPAVDAGTVYFSVNAHPGTIAIVGLDVATGAERWRHETAGAVAFSSPAVKDGTLFVGAVGLDDSGMLMALDARTGRLTWNVSFLHEVVASPAVGDGVIFIATNTGEKGSVLSAIDIATGATRWEIDPEDGVIASPLVSEGRVFVAGQDGQVTAIDAGSGEVLWETGELFLASDVTASPAIADGTLFVHATNGFLLAINAANGRTLWEFAVGPGFSSPVVAGGVVYVGSDDHSASAIDVTRAPRLLWRIGLSDKVQSSPAIADGLIYLGTADGVLHALGGEDERSAGTAATASPQPPTVAMPRHREDAAGTGAQLGRGPGDEVYLRFASETFWAQSHDAPLIAHGMTYAGGQWIAAVSLESGLQMWTFRAGMPIEAFAADDTLVFAANRPDAEGATGQVITRPDTWIFAVDPGTGREIWRVRLEGLPGPAPILTDAAIVVATDFSLTALDPTTGAVLWEVTTDGRPTALAARDGHIYASWIGPNEPGILTSVAARDGKPVWRVTLEQRASLSLAIAEGHIVATGEDGAIRAYDSKDGREEWSFRAATEGILPFRPTVGSGAVYLAEQIWSDGGRVTQVRALDLGSGTERWAQQFNVVTTADPTLAGGYLYVPVEDGILVLDATSGEFAWTYGDDIFLGAASAIAVPDEHVVFRSERALVVLGGPAADSAPDTPETGPTRSAVVTETRSHSPSASAQWAFQTGNRIEDAPQLYDHTLFVSGDDGFLYAIDVDTGLERWSAHIGHELSSPLVAGQHVYVVSHDFGQPFGPSEVLAFDTDSGEMLWHRRLPGGQYWNPTSASDMWWFWLLLSAPAGGNSWPHAAVAGSGTVNVQVMAGHLYSLDADTGQIRWKLTTSLSFVPPTPSDEAVIAVRSLSSVARVNEQTGALEWETGVLLPNSWFPWIEAGPRVQGGLVYVGTGEETLHALDLKNGVEAWRAEIPHSPVALVVTPKAVIVACQLPPQTGASGPAGSLHAFDPRTGMPLWERAAGLTAGANLIPVFLSTDGETMLLTSGDGLLEVISPATGATVASTTLGVAVTGEPLVAGETAYVPIADGAVLAVSLRNIEATPIPATSVP